MDSNYGIHYDEYFLEWDSYNGYGERPEGQVYFLYGNINIVPDPGDSGYDDVSVRISITHVTFAMRSSFENFADFPEYMVHFPVFSDKSFIITAPANESYAFNWFLDDFRMLDCATVDFITYPAVLDPSQGYASASVWTQTEVFLTAELINPTSAVPEPATMLLLALGLFGLAAIRKW